RSRAGLTLSHQVSGNAFMPLLKPPLKSAGNSFFVRSHKICQAARYPTLFRRPSGTALSGFPARIII
ncbi:hypothetical protein, partial [Deinococcus frigens]|uniref:hypothetical protein n=1 Tax=Deinococcus frigens TaxID=249403 RepID=UPI0039EF9F4C